jgi:hypothetical protein
MLIRSSRPLAASALGLALGAGCALLAPPARAEDASAVRIEIRSPRPGEDLSPATNTGSSWTP